MPSEVIILGCGATNVECKYHTEVWGVNGTYTFAKRLDKLFMTDEEAEVNACWYDLVKMLKYDTTLVLPAAYKKFQDLGIPIEIYPMDEMLQKFPTRFYSNSIAYMIAYALNKTKWIKEPDKSIGTVIDGYNKIYFYGIDMLTHSTYVQEKGGVEYWMGVAMSMGVEVINCKGSATGKCWNGKMYGYWGSMEEEKAKEALMAPWELVRVGKQGDSQNEWIKIGNEYKCVKSPVKAGDEVVKEKGKADNLVLG